MIVDLFIPRLREEDGKYLIHNDNGFIHLLPKKKRVQILNS